MPDWNEISDEIRTKGSTFDIIRRKYVLELSKKTGRNVILYYSGWLQRPDLGGAQVGINDQDKVGFMTTIHGLDRTKGLDLILHTPGGEMAATESLVDYIRQMFGSDIRAIVPQLAMSAGTMMACSCKSVLMGKQSSLGPIDPQIGGVAAHGIREEFERAYNEIKGGPSGLDQAKIPVWQPIIAKYNPTLVGEAQKVIAWSEEMVKEWLVTGMLKEKDNNKALAERIVKELGDHALTKSHSRHLSAARCKDIGLNIEMMEDDKELQDAILSVHHACIHTLSSTGCFKIIENQDGKALLQIVRTAMISSGPYARQPDFAE
jgi:ATP-dependent protease ClpP protease subunit